MASTSKAENVYTVEESPIVTQPISIVNQDLNQITLDSDFSDVDEDLILSAKQSSQKSEPRKLLYKKNVSIGIHSIVL